jgi:acyl-CoA synthetase (AMP-forming)/AMP-acid ligase II
VTATVGELIDRAAGWFGDAVAVVDGDRRQSFSEVGERSNRLANAFVHLSPATGARVAILMPNRLEFVETDFAIAKAGKVRVPINPRLADREREYLLANSGAETLVYDVQFAPFVEAVRNRLPDLRSAVAVGGDDGGAFGYESMVQRGSPKPPGVSHAPEDPNFILYTSGTTGQPKGATATNRSRLAATFNMLTDEIDAGPGDAMAHIGAMAHGSGSKVLAFFLRGARNITIAKFEPDRFLELVEGERVTNTFVVPTMVAMLVEAAANSRADITSLRGVSYGGAPIAPARLQEAMEALGNIFVQVYGSCEAPHPVLVLSKKNHLVPPGKEARLGSLGREVTSTEVRVAGPDGSPNPVGERGEMWIRGDNVMRGYWNNGAATEEVFEDGWYKTGDVCYRDEDGFIYIVDRARDMIITGGLNVYPAEVEAALHRHPAVAEVAVFGIPDDHWGETVKAVVVLKPGASATAEAIIEHCRKELAGYKKPHSVDFVEMLPKGSTGKILKRDLQAPYWAGQSRRVH